MLKIQEIREIIKLIDQSSIEKFTFESEGTKIKLEKAINGSQNSVQAEPQRKEETVQQERAGCPGEKAGANRASTCKTRKQRIYSRVHPLL